MLAGHAGLDARGGGVPALACGEGAGGRVGVGGEEVGALKYLKGVVQAKTPDDLRGMADFLIDKLDGGILVLAAVNEGKVSLVVKADKKAVAAGVHAGKIVKEISKLVGGGGGGRPDMAQAGGKNPEGIPKMFDSARKILSAL